MRNAILRLTGLQKTFPASGGHGQIAAVDDLDLTIFAGEFLAVVGPSGGGKSTLINLVAGFIKPTRGEILKNGLHIRGPGPDRVVVFQDHAIFPWYTALENVAYGLRRQKLGKKQILEKAYEALTLVGLVETAQMYPAAMSGGMRQRVALARVLVLRPDILLLDEPFAALDAITRAHLQDELLKLWADCGWTIIFVTHNLAEAVYLADRVVVLNPPPRGLSEIVEINIPRPRARNAEQLILLAGNLELGINTFTTNRRTD
ncbi:MAG: ABC transporter ATP-binding protein [Desulfomonilia bacterium]|jgi:NitT/TauT family transport system ATP-binding protein|nr:ABC transporter ATP-binding protein [Desulfomonilia bacterium]